MPMDADADGDAIKLWGTGGCVRPGVGTGDGGEGSRAENDNSRDAVTARAAAAVGVGGPALGKAASHRPATSAFSPPSTLAAQSGGGRADSDGLAWDGASSSALEGAETWTGSSV